MVGKRRFTPVRDQVQSHKRKEIFYVAVYDARTGRHVSSSPERTSFGKAWKHCRELRSKNDGSLKYKVLKCRREYARERHARLQETSEEYRTWNRRKASNWQKRARAERKGELLPMSSIDNVNVLNVNHTLLWAKGIRMDPTASTQAWLLADKLIEMCEAQLRDVQEIIDNAVGDAEPAKQVGAA